MTNEEFLNKKFPASWKCLNSFAQDRAAYLLDKIDWMEEHLCNIHIPINGAVIVDYIDNYYETLTARGSCLLEAIENAQKGMVDE